MNTRLIRDDPQPAGFQLAAKEYDDDDSFDHVRDGRPEEAGSPLRRRRAGRAIAEGILDKDSVQKLIENGDEFQTHIIDGIRKLSLSDQYADEEVESSYGYLSGYRTPKPIDEQVKLLNGFFPNLGNVNEKLTSISVLTGSEGLFAIPRWQQVAATYKSALLKAFKCLRETSRGKFYSFRDEVELGSDRLWLTAKTAEALETLAEQQLGTEHHVMILPCQFGLRHRGRSVRRAREVMWLYNHVRNYFSKNS